MSMTLNRQSLEVERQVADAQAQLPVRAEALASGAGRESVEILMEDAAAIIENTEIKNDRVVVSGNVQCQCIYVQGQDGNIRALSAQAPFEQVLDMEGVRPKMSVRAQAAVEHVEAAYELGHMIFSVSVSVRACVHSLNTVEPVTSIEGEEPTQQQFVPVTSRKLNAEAGGAISLRDSVSLPAELDARIPLMYWARPRVRQMTRDLGGVRVSGETAVEAMVLSGVKNRPIISIRYQLPFEQLIELPDWLKGEYETDCEVKSLRMTVEAGQGEGQESALAIECGVQVALRVMGEEQLQVLSDAYQTGAKDLSLEKEAVEICTKQADITEEITYKNTMLLSEGSAPAGTVLAAHALPVIGEWRVEEDETLVEGILETSVIYLASPGSEVCSARGELPFQLRLKEALDPQAWIGLEAVDAEASALMSDRLEVRCRLCAQARQRVSETRELVTNAVQVDAPLMRTGLGLCYPQKGDTVWTLARRYRVPVEDLRSMGEEEDAPLLVNRGKRRSV